MEQPKSKPQHVAIIMDGNGRWAQQRGEKRVAGHKAGIAAVKAVIKAAIEHEIAVISLFAFSSENWQRPAMEVKALFTLFGQALSREVKELHDNGICLRFIGNRARLSSTLKKQMQQAELLTRNNSRLQLVIAIDYGGRWDLLQATKQLAQQVSDERLLVDDINERIFQQKLSLGNLPEPDLFIRTSGEKRISNFFLWQLAYTELYFCDTLWPDFGRNEFNQALTDFACRKRRFGLIDAQLSEDA